MSESIECSCYKLPRRADGLPWHVSDCPNGTTEDRVRTVREAYQATMRANEDGLPWTNPWAAVVAALDVHDEPRTKALAEVATKLGYELGRKEALAEVTEKLITVANYTQFGVEMLLGPQEATAEPRSDPDGHSDLPEATQGLSNRNPVDLTKGGQ